MRAGGTTEEWLRTRAGRGLIAGTLGFSLVLGGAFLSVDRLHSRPTDSLEHPGDPLSDAATEEQVVTSAQQIVTGAGLGTTAAGYLLMSCKDQDGPPYQGAIHLTFGLPPDARGDAYFGQIAATLVTRGWTEGLPPRQHVFGKTLSRDGVTAIIYHHGDDAGLGVLRVYGQCRNINDHRRDPTAWADITSKFNPTR